MAKGEWKNVSRRPCKSFLPSSFFRFQSDIFSATSSWLSRDAAALFCISGRIPDVACTFNRRRNHIGRWICYAALLLNMGLVLRKRSRAESVASHRSRMENHSPPPVHNFEVTPVVTAKLPYDYEAMKEELQLV